MNTLAAIALIAMSLIYPFIAILAYRQGVRDGRRIDADEDLEPIMPPKTFQEAFNEALETDEKFRARIQEIDEYQP